MDTSHPACLGADDVRAFEPEAKIGLVATRDPEGLPHVSLITSLMALDGTHLAFGQFCEGASKRNVRGDPRLGFLVMNQDKHVWRGKARWTHLATEGAEYERYNRQPMFRYNTYFGVHTVHYLDLVAFGGRRSLSMPAIVAGSLVAAAAGRVPGQATRHAALKPWALAHINKLATLKFVVWIDVDGFPTIAPVIPCQAANPGRLVLAPTVYASELDRLQRGQVVAVFALSMAMESVLARGTFAGYRGAGPLRAGAIDVDWVYNTMPPQPAVVYPPQPLEPLAGL